MSELKLPTCISCKRPILPYEKGVRLVCPNCGEVEFWRCHKCRKLVNTYVCPKCGFKGP
ncbi:MAG TPA: DUF1610 domain-containing protein [Candidatus Methanomethylia archaeon]|nr:DUF1610 domain-containing protein [Candidatus Verstraetearchaeota archaeon]HDI46290.1 DUF1610 domain-containing protein [Candidatus Methanomethylicia archaeon]